VLVGGKSLNLVLVLQDNNELRQLAIFLQSKDARVLDREEDEMDDMAVPATVKEAKGASC
jgi:hypothetical protein